MEENGVFRADLLTRAFAAYGTQEEHLWMSDPDCAVLRHPCGKWYGIVMDVANDKLGLPSGSRSDILVTKCDPAMRWELLDQRGFLPAYHMNREHWITVLLDGSVSKELAFYLLDRSYAMAGEKSAKRNERTEPCAWIVPANPKYFDLEKAFAQSDEILWKQSNRIIVGDTVYLYLAAPHSAIRYECSVTEVNVPYEYDDGKIRMNRAMNLKLRKKLRDIGLARLQQHGVATVRNCVRAPYGLQCEIERQDEETEV